MVIHSLKIEPKYFKAVHDGIKNFEIRKNDRNYQNQDLLLLREYKDDAYTGLEVLRQITFLTEYEQKEGFLVMSLKPVPSSFQEYINMTDKEKKVFETVLAHANLYGFGGRDTTNTFWEIIEELIGGRELTEDDQRWYRDYWNED